MNKLATLLLTGQSEIIAKPGSEKKMPTLVDEIMLLEASVRGQEPATTTENSAVHRCSNTEEPIQIFHSLVSNGHVFIFSCCDRLLFRRSVHSAINFCSGELPNSNSLFQNISIPDGLEFICNACHKYLCKDKMRSSAF